jgi:hypothetical protein
MKETTKRIVLAKLLKQAAQALHDETIDEILRDLSSPSKSASPACPLCGKAAVESKCPSCEIEV